MASRLAGWPDPGGRDLQAGEERVRVGALAAALDGELDPGPLDGVVAVADRQPVHPAEALPLDLLVAVAGLEPAAGLDEGVVQHFVQALVGTGLTDEHQVRPEIQDQLARGTACTPKSVWQLERQVSFCMRRWNSRIWERSHIICISDGKLHDVKMLDQRPPEPGAIYVMDRAYSDFRRLFRLQAAGAIFVVRAKSNLLWRRRYSRPVDQQLDLRCDQTIVLTGAQTAAKYPQPLRRVGFRDTDQRRTSHFLTNNFEVPARMVADLYRRRWRIELLLRWLQQHLRIQRFLGTSGNAVKTQIWIEVSVNVLIAILKKRLELPDDLYTILRVLDLTPVTQVPLLQLLTEQRSIMIKRPETSQLYLFETWSGPVKSLRFRVPCARKRRWQRKHYAHC